MTPADLRADLAARGVTLSLDGGKLLASPWSVLTPADKAALSAHKPALLALLDAEARQAALDARTDADDPFAEAAVPVVLRESCLVRLPSGGYVAAPPGLYLELLSLVEAATKGKPFGASPAGSARAGAAGGKSPRPSPGASAGGDCSTSNQRRLALSEPCSVPD